VNHPISSTDVPNTGTSTTAPQTLNKGARARNVLKAREPRPPAPAPKLADGGTTCISSDCRSINAIGQAVRAARSAGDARPVSAVGQSSLDELLLAIESWLSTYPVVIPSGRKSLRKPPLAAGDPPFAELSRSGPAGATARHPINPDPAAREGAPCHERAQK
jgi:hypothetical protein